MILSQEGLGKTYNIKSDEKKKIKLTKIGSGTEYSVYATNNVLSNKTIKLIKASSIQKYFPLEHYEIILQTLIDRLNIPLESTLNITKPLELIYNPNGNIVGYIQNKIDNSVNLEFFFHKYATIENIKLIITEILKIIKELSDRKVVNIDPFIYNYLVSLNDYAKVYLIDFGKHILIYDENYNEINTNTNTSIGVALQMSIRNILNPLLKFLEKNMRIPQFDEYLSKDGVSQLKQILNYYGISEEEIDIFTDYYFNNEINILDKDLIIESLIKIIGHLHDTNFAQEKNRNIK